MTETKTGSSALKVEDLAKTFSLSYAQMAKAISAYERVTEAPFLRLGRCKQIPPEFLEICTIAVKEVKSAPNATYRSAFERAIVRRDQRRYRTTPMTLAAALQGVELAQDALTHHLDQHVFDHRHPDRIVALITRLRERTRLLQRLLPELDADGPEAWTPQQGQDIVVVLKLLADATAGLLATDQLLYAYLRYWEGKDDKTYKALRTFLAHWEKLNGIKSGPEHADGREFSQEATMTQPSDETPEGNEISEELASPLLPKTAPSWDEYEKWPVLDDLTKGLGDLGGLGETPPEDEDELDLDLDLDLDEGIVDDHPAEPGLPAPLLDLDDLDLDELDLGEFDLDEPGTTSTQDSLATFPAEEKPAVSTRTSTRIRHLGTFQKRDENKDPVSQKPGDEV